MLVLSRKKDETVEIRDANGNVILRVKVCQIRGNQVRLGIEALDNLKVKRGELKWKS